MAYKGRFTPRNPEKYLGDPRRITYRSGLELTVMNHLDKHPNVIGWSSEEIVVPYRSPIDGRQHRYFVDLFMRVRHPDGRIEETLIEVKPAKQCGPPKVQQRKTRRYINEVTTWGVNEAKWQAATSYALSRGWTFKVLTDKEIRNLE